MPLPFSSMNMPVLFLSAWAFLCGLVLILGIFLKSPSTQKSVNDVSAPNEHLLKKNEEISNALLGRVNFSVEKISQIDSDLRSLKNEWATSREQSVKEGLKLSSDLTALKATLVKIEEKVASNHPPIPSKEKEEMPPLPPKEEPSPKPIFPHAHVSMATPVPSAVPVVPPVAATPEKGVA